MTTLLVITHVMLWSIFIGNLVYLRRSRQSAGTPTRQPMVSVLVPARNEEANLESLIPAVLSQSYPSVELIVYDDDSTDRTKDVVDKYSHDRRLKYMRGYGPPAGWVGKVAALYAATREASGDVYLFLDADVRLLTGSAIERIVQELEASPSDSVVTVLPALAGAGRLLVSMVPFTILSGLPWFLVRSTRARSLAALNGQAWMIPARTYHALEPHEHVKDNVLEDVEIGRYLKSHGVYPRLLRVSEILSVHMYATFADAWKGFRKNAYLIMGGRPDLFTAYFLLFALATWLSPLVSINFLISAWALKLLSDRLSRIPLAVSLVAPVSFMLATFLQLDSAISHWTGRVAWKGRDVSGS